MMFNKIRVGPQPKEETAAKDQFVEPSKIPNVTPKFDTAKHRKKIDNLLADCLKKIGI